MKKSDRRRIRVRFAILAVLLLIGILLDINAGYSEAGLQDLFAGNPILVQFRLPRVLVSLLVGIALSLSGSIMQSVTGNDMAEPGLLGINAGAGLFIALFIFLFRQGSPAFTLMLPLLAFAGSVLTFFTEYRLASSRGRVHPKRLLLMGVAISIALTSLTTVIMLKLPDSQYAFVQNWIAGNIWGADWNGVLLFLYVFFKSRTLNGLMLGHDVATGIGINTRKESRNLLLAAVGLSSLCCAVGGGMSFAGLVAPHLARKLVGPNYVRLLPAAVLVGAVMLVFADLVSRTCFLPFEMPIGIVTAVLGAPYFLYLLIRE
ncbi:FecCD family ABC transporter permease [Faecalibaculum rodentium]|uniref:FecCD family ABC transporter permease n=1 Tax=Faecalibaculum rodentium TaxID=1702221 RepID=UPI00259B1B80|nr:iron ABC transporter permease [Faecalibaculum rodentium]